MAANNNDCMYSTKGSYSPFLIEAGLVIFNRTSGSVFPNNTNAVSFTVTSTATASASNGPSIHSTSSSLSPARREAAVGAGVGGVLGLGLLVTLVLLWRERTRKRSLRNEVQTWEGKYSELMNTKPMNIGGAEHQTAQQLHGWHPEELDDQSHVRHQLEGSMPDEVDGREVS